MPPFPLALRSTIRLDSLAISSFTSCRWDRVGTSGRFAETNELGDKIEGGAGMGGERWIARVFVSGFWSREVIRTCGDRPTWIPALPMFCRRE